MSFVPAFAKPPLTKLARHMAQRAPRKVMMHFLPVVSHSPDELVPSPYFAAFMAGNHFTALTRRDFRETLILEHRAARPS
jgi:hypothetical protein